MTDELNVPNHIAFIIDGNGRWAKKRGLPRVEGHRAGVKAVQKTIDNALKMGIKVCSFFVFSTENWNRDKSEVDSLMIMLKQFIKKDISKFVEQNIKLVTMGNLSRLPVDCQKAIISAKEKTENMDGMIVNICINYGGRDDIVNAVNNIIKSGITSVDANSFSNFLYSKDLPDPDLIIRTSGELRLSNFMLWQGAYSELYFPKIYWPDFDNDQLQIAIKEFSLRDRRFGRVKKG